ncbi:MAG: hypothetical protein BWY76_02088 [bacterium ADurb.Bin429]|nr:MAG: hypothetical protein BWY76_02088 [bacterium ADurb.Bin429]
MAYPSRLSGTSGAPLAYSVKSHWLASLWLAMYPWR